MLRIIFVVILCYIEAVICIDTYGTVSSGGRLEPSGNIKLCIEASTDGKLGPRRMSYNNV